jgi:Phosphoesterase family
MGQVSRALFASLLAACLLIPAGVNGQPSGFPRDHYSHFPRYDHVFLLIEENEGYAQVIGNSYAPIMNALAQDYGLATNYRGVADPSEPNYIAMLGGDFFAISSDDPYWFPGHTVKASNLMSQLERAGRSWRGYFQGMPYPGYRGYCYPDKCNGIPDADTQYVAKHNGIVNFANLQTPAEFRKMVPIERLRADLLRGTVADFSYIVPNECNDSHGAPPWCVDSNNFGSMQQNWLIAEMDKYAGYLVNQITSSPLWQTGTNAIVITFDEGNEATSKIATIVITSHGPRGVKDKTSYSHYSLLASLQRTFGLGCLRHSCTALPMAHLFTITGSTTVPALPPAYVFATSSDRISRQGAGLAASKASITGAGWQVVPSRNLSGQDNVLAAVSAASFSDAWAVGTYYRCASCVLSTMAHHFDGIRWTAYPLPNVGAQENALLAVSMPSPNDAWAVGYYVNGQFKQKTLVEHFDGREWSVVPSQDPGRLQNILYGVAAISDNDVWAVGEAQNTNGSWRTLSEHWDGLSWSVVPAVDPGLNGNQFYAVKAIASDDVYAVGQRADTRFPNRSLIEHWNGTAWHVVPGPADVSASALPLGLTATPDSLTVVGQQETDIAPYTTYVAAGARYALSILKTPNAGASENDLFAAETGADGSTWAVGWDIVPKTGNHAPLLLHGVSGAWSIASSPRLAAGSDSGFGNITAIPGGGLWAVGVTSQSNGNYATLIEYHR